jgi:hypothetical protein
MVASCGGSKPPTPAAAVPATVSVEQFGALRWLEGSWRGSEAGGPPFYESYRYENDSVIRSLSYGDSTFATPTDSGTIRLTGGVVRSGSDQASWIVTSIDSTRVHFEPEHGVSNAFEWIRRSTDAWTATLSHPVEGQSARIQTYEMSRIPR